MAMFAVVLTVPLAGCAPAWIQEGIDRSKYKGGLALTQGMWLELTIGYGNDIACEAAGAPPPVRGISDWPTWWSARFQALTSRRADGSYKTERPDLYLNYIVRERGKAGLPDFPESLLAVIPPSSAKTPDWIEHPNLTVHTYGKPHGPYCMWPKKAPSAP